VRYDLTFSYGTEIERAVFVERNSSNGAGWYGNVRLGSRWGSGRSYRFNGLAGSVANSVVTTGLAAESSETEGTYGHDGEELLNHNG
jgi:hypothetical protein